MKPQVSAEFWKSIETLSKAAGIRFTPTRISQMEKAAREVNKANKNLERILQNIAQDPHAEITYVGKVHDEFNQYGLGIQDEFQFENMRRQNLTNNTYFGPVLLSIVIAEAHLGLMSANTPFMLEHPKSRKNKIIYNQLRKIMTVREDLAMSQLESEYLTLGDMARHYLVNAEHTRQRPRKHEIEFYDSPSFKINIASARYNLLVAYINTKERDVQFDLDEGEVNLFVEAMEAVLPEDERIRNPVIISRIHNMCRRIEHEIREGKIEDNSDFMSRLYQVRDSIGDNKHYSDERRKSQNYQGRRTKRLR